MSTSRSNTAPCCPPLCERPLTAAMFKALGDPVRLRLFSRIASHEGVSQPTVGHHLKKLREAGLLRSERHGTWVYYRVAPGVLASIARSFAPPS